MAAKIASSDDGIKKSDGSTTESAKVQEQISAQFYHPDGRPRLIHRLAAEEVEQEPLNVRVWRAIAVVSGLPGPPTESDYRRLEKMVTKENGGEKPSPFQLMVKGMNSGILNTAKVLHAHTNPHDIYRLMKESNTFFAFSVVLVTLVLSSCLFAAWGTAEGCIDPTPVGFIPRGFMIISGLGTGLTLSFKGTTAVEDSSDACLWMETIGVMFGVYTLLPCFGAMVLIRLLDNRADIVKISDVVLLTKRFGQPCLQFRVASAAGSRLHNLECSLTLGRTHKDAETGESFVSFSTIPLSYPSSLDAYALNVVHYADKDSALLKEGQELITIDDSGCPRFHRDTIFCQIMVRAEQEQGERTTISYKGGLKSMLIEPTEDGALPSWKACMVYQGLDWVNSEGKLSTTIDISALSKWEYKQNVGPPNDAKV
jgi:hypothetical protein